LYYRVVAIIFQVQKSVLSVYPVILDLASSVSIVYPFLPY
jgi:hypothetical protein